MQHAGDSECIVPATASGCHGRNVGYPTPPVQIWTWSLNHPAPTSGHDGKSRGRPWVQIPQRRPEGRRQCADPVPCRAILLRTFRRARSHILLRRSTNLPRHRKLACTAQYRSCCFSLYPDLNAPNCFGSKRRCFPICSVFPGASRRRCRGDATGLWPREHATPALPASSCSQFVPATPARPVVTPRHISAWKEALPSLSRINPAGSPMDQFENVHIMSDDMVQEITVCG